MISLFSGWKQIQQQQQNAGPGGLQQVDPRLALEDAGAAVHLLAPRGAGGRGRGRGRGSGGQAAAAAAGRGRSRPGAAPTPR